MTGGGDTQTPQHPCPLSRVTLTCVFCLGSQSCQRAGVQQPSGPVFPGTTSQICYLHPRLYVFISGSALGGTQIKTSYLFPALSFSDHLLVPSVFVLLLKPGPPPRLCPHLCLLESCHLRSTRRAALPGSLPEDPTPLSVFSVGDEVFLNVFIPCSTRSKARHLGLPSTTLVELHSPGSPKSAGPLRPLPRLAFGGSGTAPAFSPWRRLNLLF